MTLFNAWKTSPTDILGIASLYIFAFFTVLGVAGINIGLLGMLIAFLCAYRRWWPHIKTAFSDPIIILIVFLVSYALMRTILAINEWPDTSEEQWEGAKDWIFLMLFPLLSWWMAGDLKRIHYAFLLSLCGLFSGGVVVAQLE